MKQIDLPHRRGVYGPFRHDKGFNPRTKKTDPRAGTGYDQSPQPWRPRLIKD